MTDNAAALFLSFATAALPTKMNTNYFHRISTVRIVNSGSFLKNSVKVFGVLLYDRPARAMCPLMCRLIIYIRMTLDLRLK